VTGRSSSTPLVPHAQGHGARDRRLRPAARRPAARRGAAPRAGPRLYEDADIVIDQLNAGWYGVFAIEAMALGKPVLTYLQEEPARATADAFGLDVPIVSVTADTLHDRLAPLVTSVAERRRLGAASRAYVERVHGVEPMTDRLLEVYASL
jgi:glycosyltransferase involved in cell wall biosynthesis